MPFLSYACQVRSRDACLNINTIREMIWRFLVEKKISKDELARSIGVTVMELELLILKKGPLKLIIKINLPLIKLYCITSWDKSKKLL